MHECEFCVNIRILWNHCFFCFLLLFFLPFSWMPLCICRQKTRGSSSTVYPLLAVPPWCLTLFSYSKLLQPSYLSLIQFNGETVRGCPFVCRVADTSRVSLTLRHLELIPVSKPAAFNISVDGGGSAELTVTVRSKTPPHFCFGAFVRLEIL